MAARPGETRDGSSDRPRLLESITAAAVPLALIDPSAARTVLGQVEARGGLDPTTLWQTRGNWLAAWALVDLKKAGAIFEAMTTALDGAKEIDLYNAGVREMTELPAAPPDRREDVLGTFSHGGYWRPGGEL